MNITLLDGSLWCPLDNNCIAVNVPIVKIVLITISIIVIIIISIIVVVFYKRGRVRRKIELMEHSALNQSGNKNTVVFINFIMFRRQYYRL